MFYFGILQTWQKSIEVDKSLDKGEKSIWIFVSAAKSLNSFEVEICMFFLSLPRDRSVSETQFLPFIVWVKSELKDVENISL